MKVYHRWNSAGSFGPAALRPVGFYGQVFVQAQRREAWGARYKPNAVRRGVAPAKGVAAHPRGRLLHQSWSHNRNVIRASANRLGDKRPKNRTRLDR